MCLWCVFRMYFLAIRNTICSRAFLQAGRYHDAQSHHLCIAPLLILHPADCKAAPGKIAQFMLCKLIGEMIDLLFNSQHFRAILEQSFVYYMASGMLKMRS